MLLDFEPCNFTEEGEAVGGQFSIQLNLELLSLIPPFCPLLDPDVCILRSFNFKSPVRFADTATDLA